VLDTREAQTRAWRADQKEWVASGMRLCKRPHLQLIFGQSKWILFFSSLQRARSASSKTGRRLMVWASSQTEISNSTVRLEDGFLRSNGLGAKLTPPMSLVKDETGIYYDRRQLSQLEHMIATSDTLRPDQRHRAARLQQPLINLRPEKIQHWTDRGKTGLSQTKHHR